jgi:hypothetical protein
MGSYPLSARLTLPRYQAKIAAALFATPPSSTYQEALSCFEAAERGAYCVTVVNARCTQQCVYFSFYMCINFIIHAIFSCLYHICILVVIIGLVSGCHQHFSCMPTPVPA